MQSQQISYRDTGFVSKMICDLFEGKEALSAFYGNMPTVDNFKLQLFDERKLKLVDGLWNIRACTGNKLLKEINPMNMKGMPKDKVISQIKNLINTYYIFWVMFNSPITLLKL